MSKVKIIDNVVVVVSDLTKEMVEKLKKHAPEALAIFDENDNEVFKVDSVKEGSGSIKNFGVAFDSTTKSGKLCLAFKEKVTAEELADKYAVALVNLKEVEANAIAAYTEVAEQLLEVTNSIEVVDVEGAESDVSTDIGRELSEEEAE